MLQDIELFAELSNIELEEVARITRRISLHRGETVFKQGDLARDLFIVESGQVEISVRDVLQEKKALAILRNGEFFGEMALFDKESMRSATATAIQNTVLLVIPGFDFEKLLQKKPRISFKLLGSLSRRLRDSNEKMAVSGGERKAREGTLVGVAGPKNGFGKTTFAVTLAQILANEAQKRVLYIDLDLYFAEGTYLMGVIIPRSICDLVKALQSGNQSLHKIQEYLFRHSERLFTLPAPNDLVEGERVRPADLITVVKAVKPHFDYIVIDTDSGLGDLFLNVLDMADHLFFIVDISSTLNLKSSSRYFFGLSKLFPPGSRQSVLVNRVRGDFALDKVAKTFRYHLRGALPFVDGVPENFGKTLYHGKPTSDYCNILRVLARDLFKEENLKPVSPEESTSFLARFFSQSPPEKPVEWKGLVAPTAESGEHGHELELNEESLSGLLNTVRAEMTAGRLNDAKIRILKGLEFCQTSGELFQILGEIFVQEDNFSQAIDAFKRALFLDPENHLSQGFLAQITNDEAGWCQAIQRLQEKIARFPRYPDLFNDMGKILVRLGRGEEAMRFFRQALEINPEYLEAKINLAVVLGNLRKFDEAIAELMTVQNKPLRVYCLLGNFLHASGRHYEALLAYNQLQGMVGACADLERRLEQLRAYFRKVSGLLEMYQGMLALQPDYPDLHQKVGSILLTLGRKEDAMAEFQEALRLNPKYGDAIKGMQRTRETTFISFGHHPELLDRKAGPAGVETLTLRLRGCRSLVNALVPGPERVFLQVRNLRTNRSASLPLPPPEGAGEDCLVPVTGLGTLFRDDVLILQLSIEEGQAGFASGVLHLSDAQMLTGGADLALHGQGQRDVVIGTAGQAIPCRLFLVNLQSPALVETIRGEESQYRAVLIHAESGRVSQGAISPEDPGEINFILTAGQGENVVAEHDSLIVKVIDAGDTEIIGFDFSVTADDLRNFRKTIVFDPFEASDQSRS